MEPSHIEAERLLTPSLLKICSLPGWWTKISTMQLLCRMYLNYVWISVCPLFQESSWSGPESSSLQQPETRFLRVLEKKKFDVRSFSRHVEIFCETAMKCLGVFFPVLCGCQSCQKNSVSDDKLPQSSTEYGSFCEERRMSEQCKRYCWIRFACGL